MMKRLAWLACSKTHCYLIKKLGFEISNFQRRVFCLSNENTGTQWNSLRTPGLLLKRLYHYIQRQLQENFHQLMERNQHQRMMMLVEQTRIWKAKRLLQVPHAQRLKKAYWEA